MSAHLSTGQAVSYEQMQALSRELVAISEAMEAAGIADWFPVARAAVVLDGLRHNILTIPAQGEEVSHGPH